MYDRKKRRIEHWQIITMLMICYDIIAIAASYFAALLLRYDFAYGSIPVSYLHGYLVTMLFYIIVCVVVFMLLRGFRNIKENKDLNHKGLLIEKNYINFPNVITTI